MVEGFEDLDGKVFVEYFSAVECNGFNCSSVGFVEGGWIDRTCKSFEHSYSAVAFA